MAINLMIELVAWVAGEAATRTGWAWFRRRSAADVLGSLDAEGKGAFLEIVVAAAFDDDQLSEHEEAMLSRREKDAGDEAVLAAIDAVRAARPFTDLAVYKGFLAERAGLLPNDRTRRETFAACMAILTEAKADDLSDKATLYGQALQVPESDRVSIQLRAAAGAGKPDSIS